MTTAPHRPAAYGDQMAKYFRVGKGPNLVIRPPSEEQIAITNLASDAGLPERTASIPCERAFVVSVHLTPASERGCEIWVDDLDESACGDEIQRTQQIQAARTTTNNVGRRCLFSSQQFRSTGVLDVRTSFSPAQTHRRPRVTTRSATPPPPAVRAPLKFSERLWT
jgi:hypothetical protein